MVSSISASAPNYYNNYKTNAKSKAAEAQEEFTLPADKTQNTQSTSSSADKVELSEVASKMPAKIKTPATDALITVPVIDANGKMQTRYPWQIGEMGLLSVVGAMGHDAMYSIVRQLSPDTEDNKPDTPMKDIWETETEAGDDHQLWTKLLRQAHDEVTAEIGYYSQDQSQITAAQRKEVIEDIFTRFKENPEAQALMKKMGMTAETACGMPYNPKYYSGDEVLGIIRAVDADLQRIDIPQDGENIAESETSGIFRPENNPPPEASEGNNSIGNSAIPQTPENPMANTAKAQKNEITEVMQKMTRNPPRIDNYGFQIQQAPTKLSFDLLDALLSKIKSDVA